MWYPNPQNIYFRYKNLWSISPLHLNIHERSLRVGGERWIADANLSYCSGWTPKPLMSADGTSCSALSYGRRPRWTQICLDSLSVYHRIKSDFEALVLSSISLWYRPVWTRTTPMDRKLGPWGGQKKAALDYHSSQQPTQYYFLYGSCIPIRVYNVPKIWILCGVIEDATFARSIIILTHDLGAAHTIRLMRPSEYPSFLALNSVVLLHSL